MPALDVPVPQTVEQLPNIVQFFGWLSSRLSKCRRSCLTMFLRDVCVTSRSWWNSWWKYRRPYPTLRYSGLWSRTLTFQFQAVEGEVLVFKVLSQKRVQQRPFLLQNAFLSGLWSRSLVLLVDRPSKSSSSSSLKLWISLVKGFFALHTKIKKGPDWVRTQVRECPPVSAHQRGLLSTVFVSGSGS